MEETEKTELIPEEPEKGAEESLEEKTEEGTEEEEKDIRSRYFILGLLCGVVLMLVCLIGMLLYWQHKLTSAYQGVQREQSEVEAQQTTELELDVPGVADKITAIEDVINEHFLEDVDTQEVEDLIYTGMVAGLGDPYSVYYTKEDLDSMAEAISGEYSGIGIKLEQDAYTGVITVISCFEDTPAFEAGILPGDIITEVDGETTAGMKLTQLVAKIKTSDKNEVDLKLRRDTEELEMKVEIREIRVPTVTAEMLDGKIGYLKITEFDSVTGDQFAEKLEELQNEGMESLIIDLRNNPGGLLETVCDMLNLILPKGLIVYTEDKNGNRIEYKSDGEHELKIPLAVLVNENSASASEIFAGAVKDYGIGTLVGVTTYGKGIVQKTYYLSDGTGVKLTTAKYYTPKGNDIHKKGVEPDVVSELDEEAKKLAVIPEDQDSQLQDAVRILQEQP